MVLRLMKVKWKLMIKDKMIINILKVVNKCFTGRKVRKNNNPKKNSISRYLTKT